MCLILKSDADYHQLFAMAKQNYKRSSRGALVCILPSLDMVISHMYQFVYLEERLLCRTHRLCEPSIADLTHDYQPATEFVLILGAGALHEDMYSAVFKGYIIDGDTNHCRKIRCTTTNAITVNILKCLAMPCSSEDIDDSTSLCSIATQMQPTQLTT
jgi:hypothetical protein